MTDEPLVYTVPQVAERLQVGRSSVYDAILRGELRAVRLGRRVLVPRDALRAFLEGTARG